MKALQVYGILRLATLTFLEVNMKLSGPGGSGDLKHFMQTFGQSNRNNPPRPLAPSPLQPLLLMQSPVVTERVSGDKESTAQKLRAANSDNSKVVDEMFLATLSRSPSSEEKQIALDALGQDRQAGAQNLQWALLNLAEFFFNY